MAGFLGPNHRPRPDSQCHAHVAYIWHGIVRLNLHWYDDLHWYDHIINDGFDVPMAYTFDVNCIHPDIIHVLHFDRSAEEDIHGMRHTIEDFFVRNRYRLFCKILNTRYAKKRIEDTCCEVNLTQSLYSYKDGLTHLAGLWLCDATSLVFPDMQSVNYSNEGWLAAYDAFVRYDTLCFEEKHDVEFTIVTPSDVDCMTPFLQMLQYSICLTLKNSHRYGSLPTLKTLPFHLILPAMRPVMKKISIQEDCRCCIVLSDLRIAMGQMCCRDLQEALKTFSSVEEAQKFGQSAICAQHNTVALTDGCCCPHCKMYMSSITEIFVLARVSSVISRFLTGLSQPTKQP